MRRILLIVYIFLLFSGILSVKYNIDEVLTKDAATYQLSDGFMYGSGNGPWLLPKGLSTIEMKLNITSLWEKNSTVHLNMVVYGTDDKHKFDHIVGLCDKKAEGLQSNTWVSSMQMYSLSTDFLSCSDEFCTFQVLFDDRYTVPKANYYNVLLGVCYNDLYSAKQKYQTSYTIPTVQVQGQIGFKNPYGYLPAELYGLLPFETFRAIVYMLFVSYYSLYYIVYQASVLPVHVLLLCVLFLTMMEGVFWAAHYLYINYTGLAFCCPLPLYLTLLNCFETFTHTAQRLLLLTISLGYGIGRPKLLSLEVLAMCVLGAVYFALSLSNALLYMSRLNRYAQQPTGAEAGGEVGSGGLESSPLFNTGLSIAEIAFNAVFFSWIYISLLSTIRILQEFQQTEKLRMYKRVLQVTNAFLGLYLLVVVVYWLDARGVLPLPWQWQWLDQAVYQLLTLAVVCAVCVIFKPTDRSRLLAYASQLPTDDPDEALDRTSHGGKGGGRDWRGLWEEEGEEDEEEREVEMRGFPSRRGAGLGGGGRGRGEFYPLPPADRGQQGGDWEDEGEDEGEEEEEYDLSSAESSYA